MTAAQWWVAMARKCVNLALIGYTVGVALIALAGCVPAALPNAEPVERPEGHQAFLDALEERRGFPATPELEASSLAVAADICGALDAGVPREDLTLRLIHDGDETDEDRAYLLDVIEFSITYVCPAAGASA